MRRQLLKELPSLTYHYGLKPWEVERLTFREIAEYRRQMPKPKQPERPDTWD